MGDYHRFVFDPATGRYSGDFEEMYRSEAAEHFDSWHQEDARNLTRRICLLLLEGRNFAEVIDIGCGKGAFTHQLKKSNNRVIGIDLSDSAVAVASGRYPDVEFKRAVIGREPLPVSAFGVYDLAVCLETLSYVENWCDVLGEMARSARHALVALYLPDNPQGFVKSFDDLVTEFARHFEISERIDLVARRQVVLFGGAKVLQAKEP